MKYDDDKRSDQVHDSWRVGQHEEAAVGTIDWDGQKAGTSERLISIKKMTGGTPEVRSDKSLTLLTFNIWHSTNSPMDQWTIGPMDQWTNEPMDQWTNGPGD